MSTTTLGSATADRKTHAAFHRATKNIFRRRQAGGGSRLLQEHDKPAMLGTPRSASESPADAEEDMHFDYELGDPFSATGLWVLAGIAVLSLGAVLLLCLW